MTSQSVPRATLRVSEIFASIQGESSWAGWPCVFIRLAGCPLRCTYCDTTHARAGDAAGEQMEIDTLLERVGNTGLRLVEVTGGEPLMQPATVDLIRELLERDYQVLVETGGGVSIAGVDPRARIILDVKTPGSGMVDRQDLHNLDLLRPDDEVKFVICSRTDYEWARDFLQRNRLAEKRVVHFSPAMPPSTATGDSQLHPAARTLAEWILEDRLAVRLNLQLHRWIWGAGERGV